jgi:hypothetical protein
VRAGGVQHRVARLAVDERLEEFPVVPVEVDREVVSTGTPFLGVGIVGDRQLGMQLVASRKSLLSLPHRGPVAHNKHIESSAKAPHRLYSKCRTTSPRRFESDSK